jgi:hypothetical protein
MRRLISFILILFVLYTTLKAKNGGKDPFFGDDKNSDAYVEGTATPEYLPEETTPKMEGGFLERTLSKVMINVLKTEKGRIILEKMIQPANTAVVDKDYSLKMNNLNIVNASFHIKTTKEGNGDARAICGHSVNVTYRVVNMKDMIIESGKKSMILGDARIFKAMDNIIIGMKIGESRSAIIPEKFAYEAPNFNGKKPSNSTYEYKVDVTLDGIASDIFINDKVKIFDDEISFKMPALCGNTVGVDVKIMSLKGDVIFDSKVTKQPVQFKLGDLSYPVIFSYGLFNKQDKGTRTVIFSGKYLGSFMNGTSSAVFPNDQPKADQFYILEFDNLTMDQGSIAIN